MSEPFSFDSTSPRFALPLLFAGQAQKEFFVNEALLRADLLLHCVVEGEAQTPPSAPNVGEAWLVADGPQGLFAGHAQAVAGWTGAGWRFIAAQEGMRVFDRSAQCFRLYLGSWRKAAIPASPSGGAVIDAEARAAIAELAEALTSVGVFAAS
jgi:hypothetical protein